MAMMLRRRKHSKGHMFLLHHGLLAAVRGVAHHVSGVFASQRTWRRRLGSGRSLTCCVKSVPARLRALPSPDVPEWRATGLDDAAGDGLRESLDSRADS